MEEKKARSGFTSNLGFVLAAAGSAVGLGNLWRFPYLAAKDGGGLFIMLYIILSLTVGFALMVSEISMGRKLGIGPLQAYGKLNSRFGFVGYLATFVPMIIFPYYCVIGGWVTKYAVAYVSGGADEIYSTGTGAYFSNYISELASPLIFFLIFMVLTAIVIVLGVEKGIEKVSTYMMPTLVILIVGIMIYALTLSHTDADGVTRTAWDGLKVYFIPNFEGITVQKFFSILMDAFGQMFYSLSIAMGILITYGSYSKKDANLIKSINQIQLFDTGIAVLAGMVIIPSVFVFEGMSGLEASGPSLMFISLPTVFEQMGVVGTIIGALFFVLVFFAALTSSISLMETVASSIIDRFHISRPLATAITFLISLIIGTFVCLGYNVLTLDASLPNGAEHQTILDVLDYFANSILLPVVALATCVLVGWVYKPDGLIHEIEIGLDGKPFYRKDMFVVITKFVAPVLLAIILLQAFGLLSFLG